MSVLKLDILEYPSKVEIGFSRKSNFIFPCRLYYIRSDSPSDLLTDDVLGLDVPPQVVHVHLGVLEVCRHCIQEEKKEFTHNGIYQEGQTIKGTR